MEIIIPIELLISLPTREMRSRFRCTLVGNETLYGDVNTASLCCLTVINELCYQYQGM